MDIMEMAAEFYRDHGDKAPKEWDALVRHLESKDVPLEAAESAGLICKRHTGVGYYDRLRDRTVTQLVDGDGGLVGFLGRALPNSPDDCPEWVHTPEPREAP